MTISINTNFASLLVQRGLQASSSALGKSMQKLATGLRINNAGDDAAGLAVASRLQTQIRGLNIAKQNANEGVSLSDIANSALEETTNAIQDIRDMAVEAKSSTKSEADRLALHLNVVELLTEIQRIATSTRYNSLNLLTGSFQNRSFQIGANITDVIQVTISTASLAGLAFGAAGVDGNVSTIAKASTTIKVADSALDVVNRIRAQLGGVQSRFASIINTIATTSEGYTTARAGIMDTDIALETANLARTAIIQQAGISVLSQANLQPQLLLKLLG